MQGDVILSGAATDGTDHVEESALAVKCWLVFMQGSSSLDLGKIVV